MSTIVWIRVSDKRTGHHYTISEAAFDPGVHVKVESSAVDANGNPRLPKANVPLTEAVQKKATKTTETQKGSEGVK